MFSTFKNEQGTMKKLSAVLLLLAASGVVQATDTDMSEDAIKKRIAPIGAVYFEGDKPAVPVVPTGPRSGESVFKTTCYGCHGTGTLGAPKTAADWEPRMSKGFDVLLDHAINGFNSMPPKGTCMDCSDDELKSAIEFMAKGV